MRKNKMSTQEKVTGCIWGMSGLFLLGIGAFWVGVAYIAWHFISKLW